MEYILLIITLVFTFVRMPKDLSGCARLSTLVVINVLLFFIIRIVGATPRRGAVLRLWKQREQ